MSDGMAPDRSNEPPTYTPETRQVTLVLIKSCEEAGNWVRTKLARISAQDLWNIGYNTNEKVFHLEGTLYCTQETLYRTKQYVQIQRLEQERKDVEENLRINTAKLRQLEYDLAQQKSKAEQAAEKI